jgi:hypothetical protein
VAKLAEEEAVKRIDPDILALKACCRALDKCSPRMVKPTLEFLWDRYVVHPPKVADSHKRKETKT